MLNPYCQTHQIGRRELLKISGALATLSLNGVAGMAMAGTESAQLPVARSPSSRTPVASDLMTTVIQVVGVGRSGRNAVEYMIERGLQEFFSIDSDTKSLAHIPGLKTIQLGSNGQSTGKHQDDDCAAVELAAGDIRAAIDGTEILFITAGMNSGAGADTASTVARIARDMGILTVVLVTRPMELDDVRSVIRSESELVGRQSNVDSLIVLHNEKIENLLRNDLDKDSHGNSVAYANEANELIKDAVSGFVEMFHVPSHVNVDFEDLRNVMGRPGKGMIGAARASGPDRARMASELALTFPLNDGKDLSGAHGVLVMIGAAKGSLTLSESKLAMNSIRAQLSPHAHIIYGTSYDDALGDDIRITVVAAGIA